MSSSIGPYKGGLRFHPTVNPGVLKFLAFEQTIKNSLTTLPMGGAKGGSDFDPKGRSESEIRRFCQSFMIELYPYIGEFTDVPAGDIGVGEREIGYLFGQYKRIAKRFVGALTGKGIKWGGSAIRQEATGYGVVYFAQRDARHHGDSLDGKTLPRLGERERRPVHRREAAGPRGPHRHPLRLRRLHARSRRHRPREARVGEGRSRTSGGAGSASTPTGSLGATYHPAVAGKQTGLWAVPADCAFPSATQDEISAEDADNLVTGGITLVAEGANMPTVPEGMDRFSRPVVLYAPSKASNAGGVAVSGLEMAQNMQLDPVVRRGGRPTAPGDHATDPRDRRHGRRGVRTGRATTWRVPTSPASSRSADAMLDESPI